MTSLSDFTPHSLLNKVFTFLFPAPIVISLILCQNDGYGAPHKILKFSKLSKSFWQVGSQFVWLGEGRSSGIFWKFGEAIHHIEVLKVKIARIAKAALQNLPGKSILNVRSVLLNTMMINDHHSIHYWSWSWQPLRPWCTSWPWWPLYL